MVVEHHEGMAPAIHDLLVAATRTLAGLPEAERAAQALLLSAGLAQYGLYELARLGDLSELSPLLDIATRLERYGSACGTVAPLRH